MPSLRDNTTDQFAGNQASSESCRLIGSYSDRNENIGLLKHFDAPTSTGPLRPSRMCI